MNFIEATSYMLKNEGMRSLWAGLGPTLFGYLIEGAIKFGVYEATKPYVRRMLVFLSGLAPSMAFLNSHILSLVFCGAASGVAASIFLCPMEALRIRMVAQHNTGVNWVRAGSNILATEGAGFLFRGITPMLYKQVPYTITKNGSFDVVTRAAYGFLRNTGTAISPRLKVGIPVIAGAVASILSCIASQPGDMLLSLQNANAGERRRTRDIVRDILSSNRGMNGFMVGIKTRFLHVGVTVTLQLFLYDSIKQLCGIAATGSV
jgi:solute carrier family 25 phosphate transporter 3